MGNPPRFWVDTALPGHRLLIFKSFSERIVCHDSPVNAFVSGFQRDLDFLPYISK